MGKKNKPEQLIEEVELYTRYAVPPGEIEAAIGLVRFYKDNVNVLRVLREYYFNLPDAREEAVVKVSDLVDRQGVNLLVISTLHHAYMYLVSDEHVLLAGEYLQEVNLEILSFFGFKSHKKFLKACPPVKDLEPLAAEQKEKSTCPACGVGEEQYHLAGCIVEVCPWCDGQLANCNCRFEQLDTDEIEDEEQVERFLELLAAKGRIPFRQGDAPAYPGTGGGLDRSRSDN